MATHVIIDMLYDFIDGSLACTNGEDAAKISVGHINANPDQRVLYVCDCHPQNHCSFKENGGIWPVHCVKGTRGGSIHQAYNSIELEENRPSGRNTFYKGCDPAKEEYSGYNAALESGEKIYELADKSVIVSGIATEYCVKESVMDLLKNGFEVTIIKDALAYVDYQGHLDTIALLEKEGVKFI